MTQETKHTPTPWEFVELKDEIWVNGGKQSVAQIRRTTQQADEVKRANAVFIVRACNEHQAFVLVAIAAAEYLLHTIPRNARALYEALEALNVVRNGTHALAKARGEV